MCISYAKYIARKRTLSGKELLQLAGVHSIGMLSRTYTSLLLVVQSGSGGTKLKSN